MAKGRKRDMCKMKRQLPFLWKVQPLQRDRMLREVCREGFMLGVVVAQQGCTGFARAARGLELEGWGLPGS